MSAYASLLKSKGDYEGAEPLYRRALEVRERTLGEEHPDTLTSVNHLGLLLKSKGDYEGAEPLYRRALEDRERTLGEEHLDIITSVSNLGLLLKSKGDYESAEPLYRRVLEGFERTLEGFTCPKKISLQLQRNTLLKEISWVPWKYSKIM